MNRNVDGLAPPVSRERAAAVGMVVAAAVSPQVGAAYAVTLFDELGPAGQDLGARELLGIALVVVASAGAASLSHR